MTSVPSPRSAAPGEAGRSCPYCRFPLKDSNEVVQCPACASLHHADCWNDNRGCAVVACAAGPAATPQAQQPPTTVLPPATAQPAFQGAATPQPPAAPVSRGPWVAAAVLILALAIAGAAAAYVATSKKDDDSVAQDQPPPSDPPTTNEPTSEPGGGTTPTDDTGALPAVPDSQMEADIQSLLLEWHEHVVAGEYRAAWELMTERKQEQKELEEGYDEWASGQASLGRHLDPSGIEVELLDKDEEEGVATVEVTGMAWNKPGSNCSYWEGVTWVKYEDDTWLYEPGYSTTPERTAEWKPQRGRTLGWGCT